MKFLRQRQVSGRRRVDFHIRRNRQAKDENMLVTAEIAVKKAAAKEDAAKVIRVRRKSTVMVGRNPQLEALFGS